MSWGRGPDLTVHPVSPPQGPEELKVKFESFTVNSVIFLSPFASILS